MKIYYEAKALERTIDTAPRITPSTKSVLKKIIRSAPVADAVKVTRCKDCRHHSAAVGVCNLYLHFSVGVSDNDYCSFGERKTT